jgi:cardiolipin synthase (CMP-forming)
VLRRSLPQALTAVRLVIGASFFSAAVHRDVWLALALAAALTDFLDGFLARRWQVRTVWGGAFDLAADGVFFVATFSRFWRDGLWPAWLAAALLGSLIPQLAAQALLVRGGRAPGSPGRLWNRVLGGYSYACAIGIAAGGPAIALGVGQILVAWWANLLDVRWARSAVTARLETLSSLPRSAPPTP